MLDSPENPLAGLIASPVLLMEKLLRMAFDLCEMTLNPPGEQEGGRTSFGDITVMGGQPIGTGDGGGGGDGGATTDLEEMSLEVQNMWMEFMDGVSLLQVKES